MSHYTSRLWICKETRAPTSIRNVVQPPWKVISGLKNMDLFLSIDLPKVEDIAHVPPPFPECDNWAAPHKSNRNQHVYYSYLGFGTDKHGPMTELNSNTSQYLAEAVHITVCNQYKHKYVKLLEGIETIK